MRLVPWFALCLPTLALAGGRAGEALGEDLDRDWQMEMPEDRGPDGIINGEDATVLDYPMTGATIMDAYMESTFGSGDIRTIVCSSTLIAPDVVLLAAHCLDPEAFTFGFGTLSDMTVAWSRQADLTAHDGSRIAPWPEDAVFASGWTVHPQFSMTAMQVGLAENHDIALLFLEEPLDLPIAYLPTIEESEQIEVDAEVTVVGWGQQVATDIWEPPPAGTYAIKQMGVSYINELAPYEFQVGGVEEDVRKCHGDSGGPTFMEIETDTVDATRLIGVTSHAYDQSDCATKGGVDTRVDHYLEWIEQEMIAACDDGLRTACDEPGVPIAPLPEEKGGCGCTATPAPAAGWLVGLIGLLGLRRRYSKA